MPIRMEEDDPKEQFPRDQDPNRDRRRREEGGGGSGFLVFLPMILSNLFKDPKKTILLLLVGVALYYFFGNSLMSGCGGGDGYSDQNDPFAMGLNFDQKRFDATETFEPLASDGRNQMPDRVSLERYAPTRLNQGSQGSCVGWSSAYSARTILHAQATGQNPNDVAFSPAYVYNQIALQGCQGTYLQEAMELMHQQGALPFKDFGYDERSCAKQPNAGQVQSAAQFRTKGYNRLTLDSDDYRPDLNAIRQNLAQGAPVVIGMQVGGSFMQAMEGKKVWIPNQRDYNMTGYSGHAMSVIGYDDNLTPDDGGFQIMNSWSERWGDRGFAWVRYKDFDYFVKECYGLYPMGKATTSNRLAARFGLVNNQTNKTIPFTAVSSNVFRTKTPIRKGDKFKVLVDNSLECYTYIFGEETDGSAYTLFPYNAKHSPYMGIVGARLFPKNESLVADQLGSRDRIFILVSKQEIEYEEVTAALNKAKGTFVDKANAIVGEGAVQGVRFKAGETIDFEVASEADEVVAIILEFDKI